MHVSNDPSRGSRNRISAPVIFLYGAKTRPFDGLDLDTLSAVQVHGLLQSDSAGTTTSRNDLCGVQ